VSAGERKPWPGEVCSCGRPAVVVFVTDEHGDVPYCGIPNAELLPRSVFSPIQRGRLAG
jgi:hypothetical protein